MRSKRFRLTAGAAVTALVGATVAVGVAGAGYTFHSNVNFGPNTISPDQVSGTVKSSKGACEKGRLAKLFYELPGAHRGGFKQIGSDRTNSNGKFKIEGSFVIGHYKVVVPPKQLGSGKGEKGKIEDDLAEVDDDEELDDEVAKRNHKSGCSRTVSTSDE